MTFRGDVRCTDIPEMGPGLSCNDLHDFSDIIYKDETNEEVCKITQTSAKTLAQGGHPITGRRDSPLKGSHNDERKNQSKTDEHCSRNGFLAIWSPD